MMSLHTNIIQRILKVSDNITKATRNIIMGCYDYVDYECNCPVCDSKVNCFQTNDMDCTFKMFKPIDVNSFHDICKECETYIQFIWFKLNNKKSHFEMIKPNMNLIKNITKENMVENLTNDNDFIRNYCQYKLMPFKKEN